MEWRKDREKESVDRGKIKNSRGWMEVRLRTRDSGGREKMDGGKIVVQMGKGKKKIVWKNLIKPNCIVILTCIN